MKDKIKEIDAKREIVDINKDILEITKNIFEQEEAMIFIKEVNRVDFAYYNGDFNWLTSEKIQLEGLLEFRVFNNQKELLIRKTNEKFIGRVIEDGIGEKFYVKPQKCYMWGSKVKEKDNCYEVSEEKGTIYHLPKVFKLSDSVNFKYKVYNYMKPNQEDGILYNVDYRLVDIYKTVNGKDYSILKGGKMDE